MNRHWSLVIGHWSGTRARGAHWSSAPALTPPSPGVPGEGEKALTPALARSTGRGRKARRGYSFTEVLFAVMVLGIGFIMIAAMFPVTIRQTQTTMEETQAANMAKEAMAYLQSIATEYNFPVTVPPQTPVA